MNWRTQKAKYGKIKRGQRWQKRDTGVKMIIDSRCSGQPDKWTVNYVGNDQKIKLTPHHLPEVIIYHYYDLISKK